MHAAAAPTATPVAGRRRASPFRRAFVLLALAGLTAGRAAGDAGKPAEVSGLNSLPEVNFSALSQRDWNPLGSRALAIRPTDWKHAETEHFVYHFIHSYVATPIAVEAEFNYRVIANELGSEAIPGASGKSHIYIFEEAEDWKVFQGHAHLESWTGGIHSLGSLFIVRDPSFKFPSNSLGHEIAHLILFRIYQRALPRWLDEGFAEYISRIAQASFQRARNYLARPHSESISPAAFIPLARLTTLTDYPPSGEINTFYQESERLVRFLSAADKAAFRLLLDSVARGEPFDTALSRHYAGRFFDVAALEKEFLPYASKDAPALAASP